MKPRKPISETGKVPAQTNPNWANEVGNWYYAEEDDMGPIGWKDPWGRPLSSSFFIKRGIEKFSDRLSLERWTATTTMNGQLIRLAIYRKVI